MEKGKNYTTDNIKSNGEKVTYKSTGSDKGNTTKVSYNYLTVPRGGQFFIELEDGTLVWLNSESQLKYPTVFLTGKPREVELIYGEAYFDVSPSTEHQGAIFKVHTNEQEVEVLGTEFNIKAYQDETFIYTTLVEGKVLLDNKIQKEFLNPNQQLVLNKETKNTVIKEVDVNYEVSWKDGIFSFKSKPLKDIMKVLSRWYDVDFTFLNPKLETIKYIGALNKDQELEEILSIIKNTNFINAYEIKENTILIK
nr:FecR family protein [Snuella sedimenti]